MALKKPASKITGKISLSAKCVCLSVEFKTFNNSKVISDVGQKGQGSTVEVDANAKLINVRKKLLNSPELRAVETHKGQIVNWLYSRVLTSVFPKGGIYILPNGIINLVDEYLTKQLEVRKALIAKAVKAYKAAKAQARKPAPEGLGEAFVESDYPTEEEFADSFLMKWRYLAFDVPPTLENVRADIFKREQAKAAREWEVIGDELKALMRGQMAELVTHMVEALEPGEEGKKKRFNDTLVGEGNTVSKGNISDFLALFDARNIAEDADLAKLAEQARKLLKGVDNQGLRDDDTLREKVHNGFAAIKEKLDAMVEETPTRKYRAD